VRAMSRIEIMLSRDESSAAMMPHVRMQYEEHFARALLTTRNVTEALRHAERACHSAREAGVSGDFRAKMEILRLQCQGVE
jgi:hypothetical protein